MVSFSPALASLVGRNEALLLAQLLYWTNVIEDEHERDGWFYKNSKEIEEETSLSYREQLTARKNLVFMKLISEETNRLEHVIFFKVNTGCVDDLIDGFTAYAERRSEMRSEDTSTVTERLSPTSPSDDVTNTEITAEITEHRLLNGEPSRPIPKPVKQPKLSRWKQKQYPSKEVKPRVDYREQRQQDRDKADEELIRKLGPDANGRRVTSVRDALRRIIQ